MVLDLSMERIQKIESIFKELVGTIKEFSILEEKLVPEGLKLIARSVSWLIEQIVVQNLRKDSKNYGIEEVIDPPDNVSIYDCKIRFSGEDQWYHINIKTSLIQTDERNRFDVSKASKLVKMYESTQDFHLILIIIKIHIEGVKIAFKDAKAINIAWVPEIYYNRANHNLQTSFGAPVIRSNQEFVELLKRKIAERGHSNHY
jgi:hypothetical protein